MSEINKIQVGGVDYDLVTKDPYDDTQIKGRVSQLQEDITEKQDIISDLDTIRAGASAGAVALPKNPANWPTLTTAQQDTACAVLGATPQNMTGDAYSSTKTYAIGDYCISNNALWKCVSSCTGVTPSESANWTAETITGAFGASLTVNETVDFDGTDGTNKQYYFATDKPIKKAIVFVDGRNAPNISSGGNNYIAVGDKSKPWTDDYTMSTVYAGHNNKCLLAYVNTDETGFPILRLGASADVYSVNLNGNFYINRQYNWLESSDTRVFNRITFYLKYTGQKAYVKIWT